MNLSRLKTDPNEGVCHTRLTRWRLDVPFVSAPTALYGDDPFFVYAPICPRAATSFTNRRRAAVTDVIDHAILPDATTSSSSVRK